MKRRATRLSALCATAAVLTLAACGGDDAATTAAPAEDTATTAASSTPSQDTEASASTASTALSDGSATSIAAGAETGDQGIGAEHMQDRLTNADTALKAEGEPIVIGYTGNEGDPAINIPAPREGVETAVDFINNVLGGVGADPSTGTPGRPLDLVTCTHTLNPSEATACGNQIAQATPTVIFTGVDANTSSMYPAWKEIPVIGLVPITSEDYVNEGVFSMDSGNIQQAGAAQFIVEQMAADGQTKFANLWTPNGGAAENANTFFTKGAEVALADHPDIELEQFTAPAGTPDMSALAQTAMGFDPDVIYTPEGPADCATIYAALDKAGYEGDIYSPGIACMEASTLEANSEFLERTNASFQITRYSAAAPDLYEDLPLVHLELTTMLQAFADAGYDAPTTFATGAFGNVMFVLNVLETQLEAGQALDGASLMEAFATPNLHFYAAPPTQCGAVESAPAVCLWDQSWLQYRDGEMVAHEATGTEFTSLIEIANAIAEQ